MYFHNVLPWTAFKNVMVLMVHSTVKTCLICTTHHTLRFCSIVLNGVGNHNEVILFDQAIPLA